MSECIKFPKVGTDGVSQGDSLLRVGIMGFTILWPACWARDGVSSVQLIVAAAATPMPCIAHANHPLLNITISIVDYLHYLDEIEQEKE